MFTAFYKTLLLWLKYQDKSFLTKFKNYLQEYFFLVLINLEKDPKKKKRELCTKLVNFSCPFLLPLLVCWFLSIYLFLLVLS